MSIATVHTTQVPPSPHFRHAAVLGSRGSPLALRQTDMVRAAFDATPGGPTWTVRTISTRGDRIVDCPIPEIGGNAVFVREIEHALRSGDIDLAVHSAKDVPATLPPDLELFGYLPRADARDVVVSNRGPLRELPEGAVVGSSSPRRACQLAGTRPDLRIVDCRGNVETRLAKLARGDFDAILLAAAGLSRLGRLDVVTEFLPLGDMVPCVGQGAIAIQGVAIDDTMRAIVAAISDADTTAVVNAERAFLARVAGGCSAAVAAHARLVADDIVLTALIGATDGRSVRGTIVAPRLDATARAAQLAEELLESGGAALLATQSSHVAG